MRHGERAAGGELKFSRLDHKFDMQQVAKVDIRQLLETIPSLHTRAHRTDTMAMNRKALACMPACIFRASLTDRC